MTDYIDTTLLAAYPGVVVADAATMQLVVDLVNGQVGDILGDLEPVPARATAVALEAAARALRNPQGFTSVSKKIDDWTKTERWEGGDEAPKGGIHLTEAEQAELWGMVRGTPGVGTIRLGVPGYVH